MLAMMIFAFFILGWTYYMVATILMEGTIFTAMRMYVGRRADTNRFFYWVRDMLGCLMCTATEAAIWTVGVVSFALGFHYDIVSHAISMMAGKLVALPIGIEVLVTLAAAFALSLAIAGEAWGIKNVMENRDDKFLALRKEFRAREAELLERIASLEMSCGSGEKVEFDLS
jgi:hypothetical protein